ncbi:hypothetical protein IRB23M11_09130 [Alkalibacterium sp. m-11]|uniref:site-specific DNA-methyltransferase (adenine-specific) n=1 Tax=Alkalibacterium indicireducens TaxID=398758 RepID=A0ABN1ALD0_9LACT
MLDTKKYEEIIYQCFDVLRGTYTSEQSFYILVGTSAYAWISLSKQYPEVRNIKQINGYNQALILQEEINRFENQYTEFKDILTGLLDRSLVYDNKSINEKLREIFSIYEKFETIKEVTAFIERLVEVGSSKCGIDITPASIRKLITMIADFREVRSLANFCSGYSEIALDIFRNIRENQLNTAPFYYAEEINGSSYLISKLLMIISGHADLELVNKDVLDDNGPEIKFDLGIVDIPQVTYTDSDYRHMYDRRLRYGQPSHTSADWAFCQILIDSLNENGIGIAIGTKGTLVRSNEMQIRRAIVEDDLVESVITLPANLYEKTTIGREVIIFNKNKSRDRKYKVLFIDASREGYRLNRNQHDITVEGLYQVVDCFKNGTEVEGFSKIIDIEKIEEYRFTLNPKEYLDVDVLKNQFEESITLKEVAQVTRGVQLIRQDFESLKNGDYYYINVKDVNNGRIEFDPSTMITNKKEDWFGKYDIKPDDIILTSKGSTVKLAIVGDDFKPAFISGNLSRIRVNPKKFNAYVLFEFLQSEVGGKMLEGLQTGTTIKLLNTQQLERLQIPLYDIEFMNEIGERIKSNLVNYERRLKELNEGFKSNREMFLSELKF